ncbi:MAG: hypothetical protein JNK14_13820 [Chitinophagaceae bacterium]|nr:hypothetical protein [Chitinophagaceae bacterium]
MSNEIMKVSATEAIALGKQFHESQMFPDIKSAAQAIVKIQAGAEIGIPPFAAMSGIHIIQGKPSIGAGLMASSVKASGKYDYRVVQQDEKACSIDFYQGKDKIGNSTFTAEDAKRAGTKNMDKFAKNMLFARAMSNGVKWFCPDVFAGPVYVPEEMEVTEDITPVSVTDAGVYNAKTAEDKEMQVVAKRPVTTAAFDKLIARLNVPGADIDQIVRDTMDKLELTDAQAEAFTSKVAELHGGGLPV